MLSLGTGMKKDWNYSNDCYHVLFNGFIPRLWRAYMSSFDGESTFNDVVNALDPDIGSAAFPCLHITLAEVMHNSFVLCFIHSAAPCITYSLSHVFRVSSIPRLIYSASHLFRVSHVPRLIYHSPTYSVSQDLDHFSDG